MKTLICGSLAYDHIATYPGRFQDLLLRDRLDRLAVSIEVNDMRRQFGGCAGNIAYNLKLLGAEPVVMATVGEDFHPYARWLAQCQIGTEHITEVSGQLTARADITTDINDAQWASFCSGAMNAAHINHIHDAKDVTLGIVSPDGKQGMLQHAREFAESGIPFVFDPGQAMAKLKKDELLEAYDLATWLAFNDYECEQAKRKTGVSLTVLVKKVDAVIVTHGSRGSSIYVGDERISVPVVKAGQIVDPTGCGDAYRAGLLYGLLYDCDWEITGRIASLLGAIKVGSPGGQGHHFTRQHFNRLYRQAFGRGFSL